jgi:hypothetical protein
MVVVWPGLSTASPKAAEEAAKKETAKKEPAKKGDAAAEEKPKGGWSADTERASPSGASAPP